MAFMGVLFFNFLLIFILGATFLALVFFITSIILFLLYKKAQKKGKKNHKKIGAIITLVIGIVFLLPMLITVLGSSVFSAIQNNKERAAIESIENKVIVKKDEWKKGFEYNDKHLIPVNIFLNSDNYEFGGTSKNLNHIGALVIEKTTEVYSFYELDNDSGYKIYYVHVSEFVGGEYYSRTFVDENDYDSVLEYYNTSNLEISALWRTGPHEYVWQSLNLDIANSRDELIELSHEVLDDVSDKIQKSVSILGEDYDKGFEFEIQSDDGVFAINLVIYTEQMKLYLNGYEVEENIIEKHKAMLLSLINDAQEELLEKADETSQN